MIQKGLLDKHGKPNESTPESWKMEYVDYRWVLGVWLPQGCSEGTRAGLDAAISAWIMLGLACGIQLHFLECVALGQCWKERP